ncbi:MAG: hypothetical protein M3134_03050 [Actinomycetota bacterium]|nr:hypothetical protein [Actinomycetota bacterium]
MRTPKKRHTVVAAVALALSALPAVTGLSPAHAATQCQYFYGPTPSAEIDTNNDGRPEVRVPSLSNVSVCAEGNAITHGQPLRVERCDWWASCWRLLVHPQAGATIASKVTVCRSIDGSHTCSIIDQPPWTIMTPDQNTLCIGIDLYGGYPCGGGTALIAFE